MYCSMRPVSLFVACRRCPSWLSDCSPVALAGAAAIQRKHNRPTSANVQTPHFQRQSCSGGQTADIHMRQDISKYYVGGGLQVQIMPANFRTTTTVCSLFSIRILSVYVPGVPLPTVGCCFFVAQALPLTCILAAQLILAVERTSLAASVCMTGPAKNAGQWLLALKPATVFAPMSSLLLDDARRYSIAGQCEEQNKSSKAINRNN